MRYVWFDWDYPHSTELSNPIPAILPYAYPQNSPHNPSKSEVILLSSQESENGDVVLWSNHNSNHRYHPNNPQRIQALGQGVSQTQLEVYLHIYIISRSLSHTHTTLSC